MISIARPALDDLLVLLQLVFGRDHEERAVRPHLLVVLERRLDPMATFGVGALADQLGLLEAELLRRLRDPLVGVTEERLRLGDA